MDKSLGARLKKAREYARLTQDDAAKSLGIAIPTLSRYEQGHRTPDASLLSDMVKLFRCDAGWILTGEGKTGDRLDSGKRIENYRMSLRYKVSEFAKLINVPTRLLSDIEVNITPASQEIIDSIIKNTDINPAWLSTGEGPMRRGDYRTGDGRPFQAFDEQAPGQDEMDHGLMWKVLETMHFAMHELGLDLKELSENKRDTIRDLLYSNALQKGRQPDEQYARILCGLTYCEACGEAKRKEKILGTNKPETASLLVKSAPGLRVGMEGMPRKYITDAVPVEVPDSDYYIRRIDDGELILLERKS